MRAFTLALALSLAASGTSAAQELPAPAQPPPGSPRRPRATDDTAVGRTESEIDGLLAGLTDGSVTERRRAADRVIESIEPDDVPAVHARLLAPMRGVTLETLRNKMVRAVTVASAGRPNAEYDLLSLLIALPRARDTDVAIERITLARALGRVPSADAGRALLALSAAFNAAFRQEVGRIIRNQLKDYVLPAIIEARSPSEMQRIFLRQLRESLRRVTPGETVQQRENTPRDNALLAEILRAYGTMRQADAMKVVISFVNTDRAQVRDAARWAVAQYGRDAIHALREAYEMYEGRDPDLAWGWERVARELYQANDRRRDAEVAQRLDQGLAAGRAHDVDAMLGHFRVVLARHPTFERRREMVPVLTDNARRLEGSDTAKADVLWRLALWLDPEGPGARRIRGELLFLEAERSLERGVASPELYRAVLRVDPDNERAKNQLESIEQTGVFAARRRIRVFGAAGVLALAGGLLWALVRAVTRRPRRPLAPTKKRKKRSKSATATASTPPRAPPTDTAPDGSSPSALG